MIYHEQWILHFLLRFEKVKSRALRITSFLSSNIFHLGLLARSAGTPGQWQSDISSTCVLYNACKFVLKLTSFVVIYFYRFHFMSRVFREAVKTKTIELLQIHDHSRAWKRTYAVKSRASKITLSTTFFPIKRLDLKT